MESFCTHLCGIKNNTSDDDIAKYKVVQLSQYIATPGKSIRPMDAKTSDRTMIRVLALPEVISVTRTGKE